MTRGCSRSRPFGAYNVDMDEAPPRPNRVIDYGPPQKRKPFAAIALGAAGILAMLAAAGALVVGWVIVSFPDADLIVGLGVFVLTAIFGVVGWRCLRKLSPDPE
jgi:hypothetical protein